MKVPCVMPLAHRPAYTHLFLRISLASHCDLFLYLLSLSLSLLLYLCICVSLSTSLSLSSLYLNLFLSFYCKWGAIRLGRVAIVKMALTFRA